MGDIKMPVYNESTTLYHTVGHRLRKAQALIDEALVLNEENPASIEHMHTHEAIEKIQVELKQALSIVEYYHKEHSHEG